MKKQIKRMLAMLLTLTLVLASFGEFVQVKAANYNQVTLTGVEVGDTRINDAGTEWVIQLKTQGYTSDTWDWKYDGFTYEINGVVGTTGQVSSVPNNKLYLTIPVTVLPNIAGTIVTIKAGNYNSQSGVDGIQIMEDFQMVVLDGCLVHTSYVYEAWSATTFNNSATNFYFHLYDKNGQEITTPFASWNNFFSVSTYEGTRLDSGEWSNVYSGVFVDGEPINYFDGTFKNPGGSDAFYVAGFNADEGTVLTIRGLFVSSDSGWNVLDTCYFSEFSFTYDGTTWNFSRPTDYTKVTLTGVIEQHTKLDDAKTQWNLYLTNEGLNDTDDADGWNYKYQGLTYEYNGTNYTTGQSSTSDDGLQQALYCSIPTSVLPADAANGTEIVIKAGKYNWDDSHKYQGIEIVNDITLVVQDGYLVAKVTYTEHNGTPVYVQADINDSKKGFYFTAGETGFPYAPDWSKQTYAEEGDANGIFINGSKTSAYLKKYDVDGWYVVFGDAGVVPKVNDKITIKGAFIYETDRITFAETTYVFDGTNYNLYNKVIEYNGTPTFKETGVGMDGFYFSAGETAFPHDGGWQYISYADNTEESGVFVNGEKTDVYLKKVGPDSWYACIGDKSIQLNKDDKITIKGSFIYEGTDAKHRIIFEEAIFMWDGSAYKAYKENANYTGTPVLAEEGKYGSVDGFYFTSEDGAPFDEDWSLKFYAVDGNSNGVFVNGQKTAIYLKKVGENSWYTCIGDASVALKADDVVTIKGQFKVGDTDDTVTFNEKAFPFNGRHFADGEFAATEVDVTDLQHVNSKYDSNEWKLYFKLSTTIPGDVGAYYPFMAYEIEGTEYEAHWYKAADDVIYFTIAKDNLPQNLEEEYEITLKAGVSQGRVAGTGTASAEGIKLNTDYTFTVGNEYNATMPSIEIAENMNDFYLQSYDMAPALGWDAQIKKVDEDSGVYIYNPQTEQYEATDVYIKKIDVNKYYVCLSDKEISVKDGTIVMIKGSFTYNGLYKITFKTVKYTFSDNQWEAYSTTVAQPSTGHVGDANGDSALNSIDIVRMLRYMNDVEDKIGVVDADMNGNGKIDAKDIGLVQKFIVGLINEYGAYVQGAPTYDNTEDEMRIAAYVSPLEAGFADYKAAGFTTLITEHIADYEDLNFDSYMRKASELGLDVLVHSDNIRGMAQNGGINTELLKTIYQNASQYDSFRGFMLGDEPKISQLSSFKEVTDVLKSLDSKMDLFVSCYPTYIDDESAFSTNSTATLPEKYADYVNSFGNALDNFTYDFYPFKYREAWSWSSFKTVKENYMRSDWFYNLYLAADTARGSFDTGITLQSYAENLNSKDHYREVTKADVLFQAYSALAYGMKSINYFTYDTHWDEGVGTTNCMVYNGQKTAIYDAVKAVNAEIQAIDHILLKYAWLGTTWIKGTDSDGMMNSIKSMQYTSKRIQSYTASNDAIIGCLKDENGYDGFMLVNATDPSDSKNVDITVTFNSATHAKVYINGAESTVALTNGKYSATLTPGQGIFVIPYNE